MRRQSSMDFLGWVGLELAFSGYDLNLFPPRKANMVLEARQLAMQIFEDYTVSWYWIVM